MHDANQPEQLPTSVTLNSIQDKVQKTTYTLLPDGKTTICQLHMENGYTINGHSACVDPAQYNQARWQNARPVAHSQAQRNEQRRQQRRTHDQSAPRTRQHAFKLHLPYGQHSGNPGRAAQQAAHQGVGQRAAPMRILLKIARPQQRNQAVGCDVQGVPAAHRLARPAPEEQVKNQNREVNAQEQPVEQALGAHRLMKRLRLPQQHLGRYQIARLQAKPQRSWCFGIEVQAKHGMAVIHLPLFAP